MSMHEDASLSRRIWAGDPSAVETARTRYQADPKQQRGPWISTLYSYRANPIYANELWELLVIGGFMRGANIEVFTADQLDVLSTVLHWAAQRKEELGLAGVSEIRTTALQMLDRALELTKYELPGEHTRSLLALTRAQLLIESGKRSEARAMLGIAEFRVDVIRDPNQKARVYRKLGALCLKLWNPVGFWYIAHALMVHGASRGTLKKTGLFWRQ